ncbi:zinc ribbon domain-containing protein [Candidatus Bathyarchaeota archaeon]|nr:zinc ribbon domain-containing protein [Candidatus Bathyarchaeota archaeon]
MEASVICPSCNKSVPPKKFCIYCGATLEASKREASKTPEKEQMPTQKPVAKPIADADKLVVQIAPVETMVNNLKIDFSTARVRAEEKKLAFFVTLGIFKPKAEEVICDHFAAGYEVFLRVKGSYHIDYYRKASYKVPIGDQVKELIIFGQTLTPHKTEAESKSFFGIGGDHKVTNEIRLDSDERLIHDFAEDILYDESGKEVSQPSVLNGDSNREGDKILKTGINIESFIVPPESVLVAFKTKLLKRPTDVARTVEETLQISQVSLIYSPFYHALYVNKRSKEKEMKQLRIDGITGEVVLNPKTSKWAMRCPSCGKEITIDEKFCGECGARLLP